MFLGFRGKYFFKQLIIIVWSVLLFSFWILISKVTHSMSHLTCWKITAGESQSNIPLKFDQKIKLVVHSWKLRYHLLHENPCIAEIIPKRKSNALILQTTQKILQWYDVWVNKACKYFLSHHKQVLRVNETYISKKPSRLVINLHLSTFVFSG